MSESEGQVELGAMIEALRATLENAQDSGKDKKVRFLVKDTELELCLSMKHEGKAGLKFYVFTAGGSVGTDMTQRIKLKLQPITVTETASGKKKAGKTLISDDVSKD